MAMNGTGAAALSFGRLDNINGGIRDNKVSKHDIETGIKTAKGDDKAHLEKVLKGFDKNEKGGVLDPNKFGELYG